MVKINRTARPPLWSKIALTKRSIPCKAQPQVPNAEAAGRPGGAGAPAHARKRRRRRPRPHPTPGDTAAHTPGGRARRAPEGRPGRLRVPRRPSTVAGAAPTTPSSPPSAPLCRRALMPGSVMLAVPSSPNHRPGSGVSESRETGPLRGLRRAPTALDPRPLLGPEVCGSGHNTRTEISRQITLLSRLVRSPAPMAATYLPPESL